MIVTYRVDKKFYRNSVDPMSHPLYQPTRSFQSQIHQTRQKEATSKNTNRILLFSSKKTQNKCFCVIFVARKLICLKRKVDEIKNGNKFFFFHCCWYCLFYYHSFCFIKGFNKIFFLCLFIFCDCTPSHNSHSTNIWCFYSWNAQKIQETSWS